jgi:hypothetical protein
LPAGMEITPYNHHAKTPFFPASLILKPRLPGFESSLRSYPINSFAYFANEWVFVTIGMHRDHSQTSILVGTLTGYHGQLSYRRSMTRALRSAHSFAKYANEWGTRPLSGAPGNKKNRAAEVKRSPPDTESRARIRRDRSRSTASSRSRGRPASAIHPRSPGAHLISRRKLPWAV